MTPVQFSSGDLVADRRFAFAEMLADSGDHPAAAELMKETLALTPRWAAGWFRLGEMLEEAHNPTEAEAAWREALRLDPADRHGAALKLELMGAAATNGHASGGFVEALFDQYAPEFDAALVERLSYRVPELLAEALARGGHGQFAHALDLGCGTGLMGERLRGMTSFMEGVDISGGMLRRAEAKRIYDRLTRADLHLAEFEPGRADLVTAADVFMYVGALDGIFANVAAALAPGGRFAFSVERHAGPEPMVLRPSRRYAHSEGAIRALLAAHGFDVAVLESAPIRTDRGEPIEGLIVVARRGDLSVSVAPAYGTAMSEQQEPLPVQ